MKKKKKRKLQAKVFYRQVLSNPEETGNSYFKQDSSENKKKESYSAHFIRIV